MTMNQDTTDDQTPEMTLAEAKEALEAERNRLCSYIMKSAKHRCKLIRLGTVQRPILSEVAVTAVFSRPDLTENLLERGQRIGSLERLVDELERKEYSKTMDTGLPEE